MLDHMPWSLVLAFTGFMGFANTHQRHARNFNGSSKKVLLALHVSTLLATIFCIGFLVYYGFASKWYLPLVLLAMSSVLGGVLFAVLDRSLGLLAMTMTSFVAWPACAWLAVLAMRTGI